MSFPALDGYLAQLDSNGAKVVSLLNEGTDRATIDRYEKFAGAQFPDELKELWSRFNGATYEPRDACSMYPHQALPLSVEESKRSYIMFSELREEEEYFKVHFPEGFVQIAEVDAGGYWVNCLLGSPTHGAVYERVLNSDPMMRYAGDLNQFFGFLTEAFEQGVLYVVEEQNDYADPGDIMDDVGGEALRALGRQLLPGCPAHNEENEYLDEPDWGAK